MKKFILLTVVAALPLTLMAQDDDMYFVPTKENVAKEVKSYGMPKGTYYSGSNRSVDDYNRRSWSSVQPIDSAGNDIIDFSAVRGVYPDSTVAYENDYKYTKRLSRFDGYTSTSEAYWDGYRDGRWSSPWYYSSYYTWYDPWYWNDPWYYGYYGYYGGWYSPWYYGGYYRPWRYWGWYGPRYYARSYYRPSGAGRFHTSRPASTGVRSYGSGRFNNSSRYSHGSFGNGSNMSRGGSYSSPSRSSGGFGGGATRSGGFGGGGSFGGGGRSGGGGTFSRGR